MKHCDTVQGRIIGPAELADIRKLLEEQPPLSRYALSRRLCAQWNWRDPKGLLKDMAARTLLLKLQERGFIALPDKRWESPNRMRHKQISQVEHDTQSIRAELPDLLPLNVSELSQQPEALPLFEWLLHTHHYLSYSSSVGLNLKYLVSDCRGRPLACLLFGSAAWQCAPRDRFIGWNAATRQARLQEITNNTRFLLLPWVRTRCLASHILSRVLQQVRRDWRTKYARELHLVETFVDTSRFTGVCYRAANWIELGQTTGRTRQEKSQRPQASPKRVLVYPLTSHFRSALTLSA